VLTESSDLETPIFGWSIPAKFYTKPGRMLVYGTCLVAGTTRKGDTFSKAELERHGCTLIGGPVEAYGHSWDDGLNHWLPYPANVILDAEERDGQLEYIADIEDAAVQEAIRKGEIDSVSANAICRRVPADKPGKCQGMILNGFCLLGKNSTPASPGTSVKVWNCLRVNPLRLRAGRQCSILEGEKVGENISEKTAENPPKTEAPIQKTEQQLGIDERVKTLESRLDSFETYVSEQFTGINAKLDTLIGVSRPIVSNAPILAPVTAAVPETSKQEVKPEKKTEQAGPVAAVIPVDRLPLPVIVVKVEEIEAVVADRRLFTLELKLRSILNLCERKRFWEKSWVLGNSMRSVGWLDEEFWESTYSFALYSKLCPRIRRYSSS